VVGHRTSDGTFTDFAVAFPDGRLAFHKEPSVAAGDPSLAVQRGLRALRDGLSCACQGTDPVSSTARTLGVNALLQGKGADIALIRIAGHARRPGDRRHAAAFGVRFPHRQNSACW
jgi:N-methylhydantoinase A/oxoprolinase/acetone carboxylase beta subunit